MMPIHRAYTPAKRRANVTAEAVPDSMTDSSDCGEDMDINNMPASNIMVNMTFMLWCMPAVSPIFPRPHFVGRKIAPLPSPDLAPLLAEP